jgi:hypothetical protein
MLANLLRLIYSFFCKVKKLSLQALDGKISMRERYGSQYFTWITDRTGGQGHPMGSAKNWYLQQS